MIITDANRIYDIAVMLSNAENGTIGQTFADARDNPKYRKLDLMACVLAGWQAAIFVTSNPDEKPG